MTLYLALLLLYLADSLNILTGTGAFVIWITSNTYKIILFS